MKINIPQFIVGVAVMAFAVAWYNAEAAPPARIDRCDAGAVMMEHLATQRDKGELTYGKALKGVANELQREIRDEPESKWFFIRDVKDIDFLRDAIKDVFKSPKPPKVHGQLFKSACKGMTAV